MTVWKRSAGAPSGTLEQRRLLRLHAHRHDALLGVAQLDVEALREHVEQRRVGEVDLLDPGQVLERQVHPLDRHRAPIRGADAVELEAAVAGLHLERGGQEPVGLDHLARGHRRARHVSARQHVLGERGERAGLRDPRLCDVGAPAVEAVDGSLRRQPFDLVPDGHAGEAEALGQLALRRQGGPRRQPLDELLQDRAKRLPLRSAAREPARQGRPSDEARSAIWTPGRGGGEPARERRRVGDGGADHHRKGPCRESLTHTLGTRISPFGEHGHSDFLGQLRNERDVGGCRGCAARIAGQGRRHGGCPGLRRRHAGAQAVHVGDDPARQLGGQRGHELRAAPSVRPGPLRGVHGHEIGSRLRHGERVLQLRGDVHLAAAHAALHEPYHRHEDSLPDRRDRGQSLRADANRAAQLRRSRDGGEVLGRGERRLRGRLDRHHEPAAQPFERIRHVHVSRMPA